MCWTTFKTPKKLIAEEDIPIFKVCVESSRIKDDTVVYSYFKYCSYDINKVYTLVDQIVLDVGTCSTSIYRGYHSYLETECKFKKYLVFDQWAVINKNSRYICSYVRYAVKVSGYIPKGSEYYVNEWGECVSNSICLTKIFK